MADMYAPLDDDFFAAQLAAFDEQLRTGREEPSYSVGPSTGRLGAACNLLRTLETLYPRAGDAAASSPLPFKRIGRFDIERELGRGGAGIVFRAFDSQLRRTVAIKVPRSDIVTSGELKHRFLREARAAAALNHPNIVPILEVGDTEQFAFIVYEYCPGPTLAALMRARGGPLEPHRAAELIATLAEALNVSHNAGIVHRDLKPANILLDASIRAAEPSPNVEQFQPRITDFGLAKILDAGEDSTHTGLLIGTPAYMAPEQARGDKELIGPASDQFALGVLLYELLAGERPFKGGSFMHTVDLVQRCQPASLRAVRPSVPVELERICLRCLRKDPAKRYGSCQELADDLRRYLRGERVLAKPTTWVDQLIMRDGLEMVSRVAFLSMIASGVLSLWCLIVVSAVLAGAIKCPEPTWLVFYGLFQVGVFYLPIFVCCLRTWLTGSLRSLTAGLLFQVAQILQVIIWELQPWRPYAQMREGDTRYIEVFLITVLALNALNLLFGVWIHPDRGRKKSPHAKA